MSGLAEKFVPLNRTPRCLLFMPSVKLDRYGSAVDDVDVDGIIFDLEDSVALEHKAAARDALQSFLRFKRPQFANTYIRVNSFSSPYFAEDLKMVFEIQPDALMLPKVESAEEIEAIDAAIASYEQATGRSLPLYLTIETLRGHRNLDEILCASRNIFLVSPGYGDLSSDLEIDWPDVAVPGPVNKILLDIIISAKFHGIPVMDAVSRELAAENMLAMRSETLYGRSVGMIGKVAVHPRQVDVINTVYNQNDSYQEARRTVDAFNRLEDGSAVVVSAKGRLEGPHRLRRARTLVSRQQSQKRENE